MNILDFETDVVIEKNYEGFMRLIICTYRYFKYDDKDKILKGVAALQKEILQQIKGIREAKSMFSIIPAEFAHTYEELKDVLQDLEFKLKTLNNLMNFVTHY